MRFNTPIVCTRQHGKRAGMIRPTCLTMNARSMLVAALAMSAAPVQAGSETKFSAALPVWPAGLEKERNTQAVFRATFDVSEGKELSLRLTAASL